uniref:Uncharacterized protein n=1 Tax=Knipowitschia caucasica TaxID=637954 RepID=A0AAV2MGE8_KNICA
MNFTTEKEEVNFLQIENQRLKAVVVDKEAEISSQEEKFQMMKQGYTEDFHYLSAKFQISIGSLPIQEKGVQTDPTHVETAVQTLTSEEMDTGESAEPTLLQASMGEDCSFWSRFKTVAKKGAVASLAVVALGYSLSFYATETFGFQTFTDLPPY